MRYVLLTLALTALVSCGKDETLLVPLEPVGDSGISGTLTMEEIPGKAGFGELRFGFTSVNPSSRKVVGFIHKGRCASLGQSENLAGFEPDTFKRQIERVRDGTDFHAEHVDSYRDDHAFAIHAFGASVEDDSGAVLACGDI